LAKTYIFHNGQGNNCQIKLITKGKVAKKQLKTDRTNGKYQQDEQEGFRNSFTHEYIHYCFPIASESNIFKWTDFSSVRHSRTSPPVRHKNGGKETRWIRLRYF